MNEEREINLLDLLADILSHWRGLLVSMIAGAILLGGFSYVRSYREASEGEIPPTEVASPEELFLKLEDLEELLADSEKIAVYTVIDDEQESAIIQKYLENSILIKMDPYSIPKTEMLFKIQLDDMGQSYMVRSVYEDLINGVGLLQWVEDQTGISAVSADELISAQAKSNVVVLNGGQDTELGNDCLKVAVVHSDASECEKLAQCVKDYISQQHERLSQELGAHEVVLLSESTSNIMDLSLRERQISYNNSRLNFLMSCAKAKEAFTEEQMTYYTLLTGGEQMMETVQNPDGFPAPGDSVDSASKPAPEPSVSMKYVVLGAFLFTCAYAGIFFVIYLFNCRLRTADDLQKLFGISQLGLVTGDSQKKKFVIDRWIEALKNRNKRQFTREQSLDLAAAAVKISAEKNNLDSICLIGCDLKAGADTVCQELKERLKPENIVIHALDNVLYDAASMAKLGAVKNVILVEKAMSTMYDEVTRELELVSRQGIRVLGGIVVE